MNENESTSSTEIGPALTIPEIQEMLSENARRLWSGTIEHRSANGVTNALGKVLTSYKFQWDVARSAGVAPSEKLLNALGAGR